MGLKLKNRKVWDLEFVLIGQSSLVIVNFIVCTLGLKAQSLAFVVVSLLHSFSFLQACVVVYLCKGGPSAENSNGTFWTVMELLMLLSWNLVSLKRKGLIGEVNLIYSFLSCFELSTEWHVKIDLCSLTGGWIKVGQICRRYYSPTKDDRHNCWWRGILVFLLYCPFPGFSCASFGLGTSTILIRSILFHLWSQP